MSFDKEIKKIRKAKQQRELKERRQKNVSERDAKRNVKSKIAKETKKIKELYSRESKIIARKINDLNLVSTIERFNRSMKLKGKVEIEGNHFWGERNALGIWMWNDIHRSLVSAIIASINDHLKGYKKYEHVRRDAIEKRVYAGMSNRVYVKIYKYETIEVSGGISGAFNEVIDYSRKERVRDLVFEMTINLGNGVVIASGKQLGKHKFTALSKKELEVGLLEMIKGA